MTTPYSTEDCLAGCGRTLSRPGSIVCGCCWTLIVTMCRGKIRQPGELARQIADRYPGQAGYVCRVCHEWHNGRADSTVSPLIVERASTVIEVLIQHRGPDWYRRLMFSWNPENGAHSRRRAQQAA